jgi:hypothetical protein
MRAPVQPEGCDERGADERAEGREKMVAGGRQDGFVEAQIGPHRLVDVLGLVASDRTLSRSHLAEGRAHDVDLGRAGALRRHAGRRRLDDAAGFEQAVDEGGRRFLLQMPGQHRGIEHVPIRHGPDDGADLAAPDDHSACCEEAEAFPQRRPGDADLGAELMLGRQNRTRRWIAGDDAQPDCMGHILATVPRHVPAFERAGTAGR